MCVRSIHNLEHEANVIIHTVLRIRDNGIITTPLPISSYLNQKAVLTKKCFTWGGYNDKVLVIPRHLVEMVLLKSHTDVWEKKQYLKHVKNSEQLLKKMWTHYGIPVKTLSAEQLPVTDAICRSNGTANLRDNLPIF